MSGNDTNSGSDAGVSRRTFVKAAGASGVAVSLAGCNQGGNGNGGGSGTTISWGFDPTAAQENGDAIKEALHEQGGLSDDITIEFSTGNQETQSRRDRYRQLLEAGENTPDMFLMDNGWTNIFIQNGFLANLSDVLSDSVLSTIEDEYFTNFTATARAPGSGDLYGVPLFPDFPTMLYRKDLAEEAGYSPESNNWSTEPMSWQEWSNITADIQDNAGIENGFVTQWDIYAGTACCTFNEVMSTWGGAYFGGADNLFGPVGDRPVTVGEQPSVDGLNMMRKFVHDEDFGGQFSEYAGGIAPTDILSMIENSSLSAFEDGKAVMHRNWPYAIPRSAEQFDLGTMPIPYGVTEDEAEYPGTGGTVSALGGWHMTANPNSDKSDAIAQVIEAAMNEDVQLALMEIQGWLPPRPELFNSDAATNPDNVGAIANYMDTLRVAGENVLARPVTPVWPEQSSAAAQAANDAVAQVSSSQQAVSDLQDQFESIENSA